MATSGRIGPNAEVRVDGKGEHDLIDIDWTITKTKNPVTVIGKQVADRYTTGGLVVEWTGTAISRTNGSFAIDWENILKNDLDVPLVFATNGRTERLEGACVDSIKNAYDRESGKWQKEMSGKAFDHNHA